MTIEKSPYDLLIVLGKNWNRHLFSPSTPIELSEASQINALAAARAYEVGLAETILFSTGKTVRGKPAEAREMFGYLGGTGHALPKSAVQFQEISFDTETEADENKKIIEQEGARKIAVISVSDHLPRVADIYSSKGIHVDVYAAEDLAAELGPYYTKKIEDYKHSAGRLVIKAEELALRADRKFGTKGKLPTWLARQLRK